MVELVDEERQQVAMVGTAYASHAVWHPINVGTTQMSGARLEIMQPAHMRNRNSG